jgi:hypothetical protein
VVLAVAAARQAGFSRVEGYAEYDDSGSPRSTAKHWAQTLAPAAATAPMASDTPHRATE